jgi:serine phosphatase RsbU (regulator of sigma subunit)/Flp pilus assembly protein TadD
MRRLFSIVILLFFQILFKANYSFAQTELDSLFRILPKEKSLERVDVICQIAKRLRGVNADSAKVLSEEALMISKQFNDVHFIGESYNALGGAYLFKGDFYKAIDNFQLALLNFSNINEMNRAADMMNNLGVVHRKMGKYEKAIRYYLEALPIKEKSDDKKEPISLLNNIGGIYYYQKNYKKAEEYYSRVLELSLQTNDNTGIAASYNNLSLIAFEQKNYEKALELNKKALELRKLNNDQYGIAVCLNNMGRIYQAVHDYNQAVFHFLQALDRYKKTGDWDGAANSLYNIGAIYTEKKDYKTALKFLEESAAISDSLGATVNLRDNYRVMAECHKALGNTTKAYDYMRDFVILNDSIINEQSLKHTAELEAQYESGRKESEIKLLKQEKLIQEKDNERQKAEINRQRLLKNSLLAGLGFIIIIAILVLFQYLQKQKANKILKQQNEEIHQQKLLIEQKSNELAEKNKEVTDSIRYAKRIQQAIFPTDELIKSHLPESFVLFKPKDIVSGDFYWLQPSFLNNNLFYIAAVDCTGHGVPGAFMSIVGNNLLTEAVKVSGKIKPSEILDELNKNLSIYLHQKNDSTSIRDGMDISLCAIDRERNMLTFAGAYNHLYMIRNNELHIFNADKKAIGTWSEENYMPYNQHNITLQKGDVFYIFSDGYADQFGGPKGKKFKASQLRDLLLSVHQEPFNKQKEQLNNKFESWRGNLEQVDDVLVIGFKIV